MTVGQINFDGSVPYLILEAKDEKNRQGSEIPLRADLAAELRAWLDEKLTVLQDDARQRGNPIPAQLPANTKMLDVPDGLIRIFDRDLVFAGIARNGEAERQGGRHQDRRAWPHPRHPRPPAHVRHSSALPKPRCGIATRA